MMSFRHSRSSLGWPLGAVAWLALCKAHAPAEEYRDAARGFAFSVPRNWTEFSKERLTVANELGKRANVTFDLGLQPVGQALDGYPYILLELKRTRMAGASYKDLEQWLGKVAPGGLRDAEGLLADIGKDLALGSAVIDRIRNRVVIRTAMTLVDGRQIQGVSYGMIGRDGMVWFHAYAVTEDFDRHLSLFNEIAESFRYDRGFEFVPVPSKTGPPPWLESEGPWIGAVVGAVIGILYGIRQFRKRASKT